MLQPPTKSSLSAPRAQLIEWMQSLGFGKMEHLIIRDGEPVFDPPPRVIRDVKFGAESGPRPDLDDFALKAQVVSLFTHLDSLENGAICCLEVKHGLPFRMQVEEEPA